MNKPSTSGQKARNMGISRDNAPVEGSDAPPVPRSDQPLVAYRGEDGLPHPTLGTLARELRSELFRHRVSIYLEPEFVKRLDKLAETP